MPDPDLSLFEAARAEAVALADAHPQDVQAQIAAAYACDRLGREGEAVAWYDRAWALGVPADERQDFLVGYGSTLRNVGRVEESVARLTEATRDYPDSAALRAFLALAQHSAGDARTALASMLEAALMAARPDGFDGYERALAGYQTILGRTLDG